jgi:hypothetical protein
MYALERNFRCMRPSGLVLTGWTRRVDTLNESVLNRTDHIGDLLTEKMLCFQAVRGGLSASLEAF